MKNVYTNQELPHVWIKETQASARGANMFFEGDTIYSYGKHFPIAKIYIKKEHRLVLFTDCTYSNTTAKHKSLVSRAIDCEYCTVEDVLSNNHGANIDGIIKRIEQSLIKAQKSYSNGYFYIDLINSLSRDLERYIQFFKPALTKSQKAILKQLKDDTYLSKELRDKVIAQSDAVELKRAIKQKAQELAQEKALQEWLNGASLHSYFEKTMLRIKDGHVETSKGAKVKIESARVLWHMIQQGKDIKGHEIDGYTVISINGTLKIGCHEIPIEEVNRIGALL